MAEKTRQYCTFYLDKYFFGVDVRRVQEIIKPQEMTPVPLAPAVISGLINLRGQIITALDLRQRFEFPPREDGENPMNIVIQTRDETMSFLVDRIGDVLDVADDIFEQRPETLEGQARELISGAYKLPDQLLLILDCEQATNMALVA